MQVMMSVLTTKHLDRTYILTGNSLVQVTVIPTGACI